MNMQERNISLLTLEDLRVGYKRNKIDEIEVLSGINLAINAGELITFIGPNGCGKSTLIKSLIGLIPKLRGNVYFRKENLDSISFPERAERIGVVLTDPVYERNMTVRELVSMGRYPHTNWLGRLDGSDWQVVNDAIQKVGLKDKIHSRLGELSDGERQRAMIARVLAQDVDLIILDEPTAHLDLSNRMEVLVLLKKLAHEFGKGVLLSTHELGLALQVSDKIWLVAGKNKVVNDIPEELIRSGYLDQVFGNEKINFHAWSASFELTPSNNITIFVKGMGMHQACVVRMLKRLGFKVVYENINADITIEVDEEKQNIKVLSDSVKVFESLISLQQYLVKLSK
jgi:iron complex transport system ATP-binding protein